MGAYYDKLRARRDEFENSFQNVGTSPFPGGRSFDNSFDDSSNNNVANIDAVNFAIADDRSEAIAVQNIEVNQDC